MDDSKLVLEKEVSDSCGNTLDSFIISEIITYVYGEPKSIDRIANNLNLSPVKLQIYLNYLVDSNLLEVFEDENGDMIEKMYQISSNKTNMNVDISVDNDVSLLQYVDSLCESLRKSIYSIRSGDVNSMSCYVGSVPLESLKRIVEDIKKLQNEVEESEKDIVDADKADKYMLMTVFVPYRDME